MNMAAMIIGWCVIVWAVALFALAALYWVGGAFAGQAPRPIKQRKPSVFARLLSAVLMVLVFLAIGNTFGCAQVQGHALKMQDDYQQQVYQIRYGKRCDGQLIQGVCLPN